MLGQNVQQNRYLKVVVVAQIYATQPALMLADEMLPKHRQDSYEIHVYQLLRRWMIYVGSILHHEGHEATRVIP